MLKVFLENVIRDSVTTAHARRKTVTAMDVVYAPSARAARSTALAGENLPPSPGRRAAADQDHRWLLTAHLIHTRFLLKPQLQPRGAESTASPRAPAAREASVPGPPPTGTPHVDPVPRSGLQSRLRRCPEPTNLQLP